MARPVKTSYSELTKGELDIMQLLWMFKNGATVNELIEIMVEPKPAYNTISTIVRILSDKGFVNVEVNGRSHIYKPVVSKDDYANRAVGNVLTNFFDNSFADMVSHFAKKEDISLEQIDEIMQLLEQKRNGDNHK